MKTITIPDIVKMLGEMSDRFAKNPELLVEAGEILGLAELLRQAYDKLKWAEWANKMLESLVDVILEKEKEKNEREAGKRDIPPTPPIERKGEEKEEEKDSLYSACARERLLEMRNAKRLENEEAKKLFADFWERYPKRTHKKDAKQVFCRIYLAAKDKARLINALFGGLDKWKSSKQWIDGFVHDATTFLNGSLWEDNPEPAAENVDAKKSCDETLNKSAEEALKRLGL